MELSLDIEEIKRYLKYDSQTIDEVTQKNIEMAIQLLYEVASPKCIYGLFDIEISNNVVKIKDTSLSLTSNDLSKHLHGCDKVILLVATLGLELDYLIKKLEITDISLAYILNGVAVEYVEKYLDYIQNNELKFEGYLTSRFSIGYGDLELSYQTKFIDVLDATKKIGVSVLETHLMVPSKSVSAIIGVGENIVNSDLKKCDNCLPNGKCSNKCIGKVE